MILFTRGFKNTYEIEMLSRMFFPGLALAGEDDIVDSAREEFILAGVCERENEILLEITVCRGEKRFCESGRVLKGTPEKAYLLELARMLYRCAVKSGCNELRWGVLTGIRPIKLFHTLFSQGLTEDMITAKIKHDYLISDEMARLAHSIRRTEREINLKSLPMGFSLYVSIPFCPQRCSYCSFVSQSVERIAHLIEPYVRQLCVEIAEIGEIAASLGLVLQTVYFGGGTPTTLSARQLEMLFTQIARSFNTDNLLEYTVEAGRPDTIDSERLAAIKAAGVTRLSVNPQTMNDDILKSIGRKHSSADVERAFALARDMGFDNINMDIIAGLPDDTRQGFVSSLERVLSLSPDNITVHALTLKRASTLVSKGEAARQYIRGCDTAAMVDSARDMICRAGYAPYYLYRQKNTVGSLDNTGYARAGKEGLYNVFIMDETHTILAAGAGAVTKLKAPSGEQIERIYNFKYPAEYLSNYDILRERKERVKKFYEDNKSDKKLAH